MRSASRSSWVSRLSPPKVMTATADIRPMMNTTIMISTSVKPAGERTRRVVLLLRFVPVANVCIGAFAAFLAVGAEGIHVVLPAVGTGVAVLIRIAPGIRTDALDVTVLAPVAHRGVVGTLPQRLQAHLGRRILEVVELVVHQRG